MSSFVFPSSFVVFFLAPMFATKSLEFDRIVDAVAGLSLTPLGRVRARGSSRRPIRRTSRRARGDQRDGARSSSDTRSFLLRAGTRLPDARRARTSKAARSSRWRCARSPTSSTRSSSRAPASARAGGSFPILEAIVAASPRSRAKSPRCATPSTSRRGARRREPRAEEHPRRLRQKRQKLRGTLEQYTRGKAVEVPAGRSHHRAQRPVRAAWCAPSIAATCRHRARQLGERRHAVPRAGRHRRDQQRHRRARGARARGDLADPARADRPLPRAAGDLRVSRSTWRTELDVLQAQGAVQLAGQRHRARVRRRHGLRAARRARHPMLENAVPVDVVLEPPNRVLLITGPNTGGKTVALKTAGLFALMAQSGLHVPADCGAAAGLPLGVCRHRRRAVDRRQPQHVLGAHHQSRGDGSRRWSCRRWCCSTKSAPAPIRTKAARSPRRLSTTSASAARTDRDHALRRGEDVGHGTEGVTVAASLRSADLRADLPADLRRARRSLAIEMAQRLGMPLSVVAAARGFLSDDQKRLQAHLDRARCAGARARSRARKLDRERRAFNETRRAR